MRWIPVEEIEGEVRELCALKCRGYNEITREYFKFEIGRRVFRINHVWVDQDGDEIEYDYSRSAYKVIEVLPIQDPI